MSKWKLISEGLARIYIPEEKKISKKLPVFYNPVMKLNRDMSIALLKAIGKKWFVSLPLSGTGVRGIRFLLELKGQINNVTFNDINPKAVKIIEKNIKENKVDKNKIIISQKDANICMLESEGFSYCDIDPFGTPVPFLDAACKHIGRDGILAVTATDTSALAGTYPNACKRKYWATPLRNELKHEIGLRILIRRVQLTGANYEKGLVPILSYSKDHYMRAFFINRQGKKKVDEVLAQHKIWNNCGPLWTGQLSDVELLEKMIKVSPEHKGFLTLLKEESEINTVGFHDVHSIAKRNKWKSVPKMEEIFLKLKNVTASRTHFCSTAIKTTLSEEEFIEKINK